ncbi:uncharacterized protein M421DRAFT_415184 [Didymella exigua CBS 183.55]|uniref:Uncharacterized protein n=1 Tax=Didymella exigua CBS 183.55 TaxID=1150837 RepID=A0A6A5S465_9PLEO|nr:uncharacterized protein M421DRAFT_415184 [Didymella exigua CBS 183.55]KAF1934138.1 hypothetical protein M421DRAFT_415184 [Didymella exigua CBS 183.55]
MPQPPRDNALTTTQVFDDAAYLREALGLPVNQSEDDVDAQLALLARESGIEDPYRFLCPVQDISRAVSTTTVGSARSSSLSIHSHQTQSTGLTDPFWTSRDQPPAKRLPPPQITPTLARVSIAVDSPMDYFPADFKQRRSTTSTFSAAHSMSSSASSLQKTSTRRKRASFLSMFRRNSSACTSPSHHKHHGKHRGPKLDCGHSLSTSAIRAHIKEALLVKEGAIPSCCGIPLPRATLDAVLTKVETDRVLEGAVRSPELSSLRDSGYSENGMSSIELPRPAEKTRLLVISKSMLNTPPRRCSVQLPTGSSSLANEALKSLKAQQKEQLEKVSAFESRQRNDLHAQQCYSLEQLASQHENNKDARKEQHILELEDLEDAQITAEDTMRKAQRLETQNVATALKHMEAYCLSSNPDPDLAHTVTQDDFKKLDRQRLIQQGLPRKHESAINVLRSRQDRAMKLKMQKQEAELEEMAAEWEKDKAAEEWQHAQELERLNTVIEARRKRLQQRWDLKYEMWRKDWESQHNAQFDNADWLLNAQSGGPICGIPESNETTTPIHAAA